MPTAFALSLCAIGTSWLVYTFGFGMLVPAGALAVAALLLSAGRVREPDTATHDRVTGHTPTGWADFQD
ncbi:MULTISPECIES: hypothetical protein [unclassified Variovorax]|uniref:hypothetical protein n=1 Tax=unclassified Variovorax TaxID=663243 RepID=UPI0008396FB0|nr:MULTISPECIES: hypothetical protein [unclassified Variovorax]PNG46901.1 hypothetical protein CHC06_07244 [Variovorax sp. B2]PNG48448.1 hypothetical protein CHC07_07624 [Variovorax sp. B4]VTV14729.1 hypothetical protein WDL1CHR_05218 [Variovorax sp. WDL1]